MQIAIIPCPLQTYLQINPFFFANASCKKFFTAFLPKILFHSMMLIYHL